MKSLFNYPKILLLGLFLLAFMLYLPGLSGDFILDDQSSIVDEKNIRIVELSFDQLASAAYSGITGPLKRPVSVISFALNYYYFGLKPFYFKLINVIIHLSTGLGIYLLSCLLVLKSKKTPAKNKKQAQAIALLLTAFWLLHPLNVSGVLYVVQRMNELSALFTFFALIFYVLFREKLDIANKLWLVYFFLYVLMLIFGIFSKENAFLIPAFSLLIEFIIFRFSATSKSNRYFLYAIHLFFLAIPICLYFFVFFDFHNLQNAYIRYSFTLEERIYSELHILIFYLSQIIFPNIMVLSIFHDGWPVTKEFFSSFSTIASLTTIILLITASLILHKKHPIFAFGILWFFIGHSLESTIFPLELVFEHRNYVPMFGILFILAYTMHSYLSSKMSLIPIAIVGCYLLFLSTSTFLRAIEWGNTTNHMIAEQQRHPESYRANLQLGNLYRGAILLSPIPEKREILQKKSLEHYRMASQLDKQFTVAYLGAILLFAELKQPIPVDLMHEYLQALSSNPIHISTAVNFKQLNDCYIKPDCLINSIEVEKIYSSVFINKNLNRTTKSIIAAYFSDYFRSTKQLDKAWYYISLAHELAPNNLDYQMQKIKILLLKNDLITAAQLLNTIDNRYLTKELLEFKKNFKNKTK